MYKRKFEVTEIDYLRKRSRKLMPRHVRRRMEATLTIVDRVEITSLEVAWKKEAQKESKILDYRCCNIDTTGKTCIIKTG